MIDLQECRNEIDKIDSDIIRLFEQRMKVCEDVAEYKIRTGKKVLDPERERQKLEVLRGKAHGEFNQLGAQELFQQIMAISRKRQYQLLTEHGIEDDEKLEMVDALPLKDVRVVFQGVEGAYSYAAMREYFQDDIESFHVKTWRDAMEAVVEGRADYAVLPIENSTAGFVINNYDLLLKYKNYIVGEVYVPVAHMLLGVPGAELSDIRTVYSHAQALAQSADFLSAHKDWKQIAVLNTAVAAKKVMEEKDPSQAAVASRTAGELYGMEILAKEINNVKGNTTRFLILGKEPVYAKTAGKISVAFEIAHKSGSLYNILGNFIFNNVNMTMIESRPIPEKSFEYRFFVDFEGNLSDAGVRNALTGLAAEASVMRILGNY